MQFETLRNKYELYGWMRNFLFKELLFKKNKHVRNEFIFFRNLNKQYEEMKIIKFDSDLGNFLTDFMRNYTNSDVAIVNSGICRSMWQKVMVNGKMVEDMFPFEDTITIVLITGNELIKTLETIQTGSNQFFEVSNLIQFMYRKKKKFINVLFQMEV